MFGLFLARCPHLGTSKMNEQIKKLAEQAGMSDDKFGMFFAKDKHNEDGVDLEKFAELIVLACTKVMEEHSHRPAGVVKRNVKELFGVK